MRNLFFTMTLLLSALTANAQFGMKVWRGGQYEFFPIASIDSIKFVTLVTDIYLSSATIELKEGETKQLTVTVYPIDADHKAVSWVSSMPSVASVDGNGLVTAIATGSAVITATATDGSDVYAECKVTVTTKSGGGTGLLTCPDNNHPHAIDLGLPSGTKWCCCNVGASTPEGDGGYFAWGETQPKSDYTYWTYVFYKDIGNVAGFVKYCPQSDYGYDDFADGKTELDPVDDAATVIMGALWRMPSSDQMEEVVISCSPQWTQQNGVDGILVTGPSGGQIFLPATGYRWKEELNDVGVWGDYWSRSLCPDISNSAYGLGFGSGPYWNCSISDRSYGFTIRPVRVD